MTERAIDQDDEVAALICAAVYLLRAEGECYSCKKATPMFALMALPPIKQEGSEEAGDEDDCMFREITEMPANLLEAVKASAGPCFRPDYSRTAAFSYWMNHCVHCDAKQGDFFVHRSEGPFWPYDETQMDAIHATRFDGPFRFLDPNTAYSGAMVDWRDRKHGVERPNPKDTAGRKKRNAKARE